MLRTLLRRSQRERHRVILRQRRSNIIDTRQEHLDKLSERARVESLAAARIQGVKRCWDAKVKVAWIRKTEAAALLLQKTWRGVLGRRVAHEEKLKLVRVVPTKFQMQQLKKRCIVMGRFGDWQELRDPHTNHIFFYHTPTGDSQWDPPTGDELGDVNDYHCTFEDCLQVFPNLLALEHHRGTCHRWRCPACFQENIINVFPRCERCGNEKGGSGRRLTTEYEEKWETKLIVKERKLSSLAKNVLMVTRNSLTDLRPQSAVDRHFFKVRESVLLEIKQYTPRSRKKFCYADDEKEWPDRLAQRGPMSQHAYERKIRKKRENNRRKQNASDEVLRRLSLLGPLQAGHSVDIRLSQSNLDKEIRSWTKGRPITPLLSCKLTEVSLHEWFESHISNEDAQQQITATENTLDNGNGFSHFFNGEEKPLGDKTTREVSVLRDRHGETKLEGLESGDSRITFEDADKLKPAEDTPSLKHKFQNKKSKYQININVSKKSGETLRPKSVPIGLNAIRQHGIESYKPLIRKGHGTRAFASGAKYTGDLLGGNMCGFGTMVYQNGDTYVGEWKNGCREGDGLFRSTDGKIYEGEWKLGSRDGYGTLTHPNGEIYMGQWKDGRMSGNGTLSSANGDTYEGRWRNGKYHGTGKFTKANGQMFIGTCIAGKANGKGIIRYANGEIYKGTWKDDQRNGRGIGTFSNGAKYTGSWERGKFNGQGKLIVPGGEVYVGDWFMGKRDGYGKAVFANKDTYVGLWHRDRVCGNGIMYYCESGNLYDGKFDNGMRNGLGTLKLKDGGSFRGFFKNGSIHGRGIFRYGNGDIYKGQFKNGRKEGKGIFKWSNGNEFKGQFRFDKIDGLGNMKYAVGHSYSGEWRNGKKHGFGKFLFNDGNLYEGFWKSDRRHGRGKFIWNRMQKGSAEYYDGEWVNDRREGAGKYQYKNGSTFEGMWVNGMREGKGVFQFMDGSFFDGEFKENVRDGCGVFQSIDGMRYNGDWKRGTMHGSGVLFKPSGDRYEGQFLFGKKDGDGAVTYSNGNIFVGKWKNGRRHGHGQYLYQARDKDIVEDVGDFKTKAIMRMSVFGH